MSGTRPLWFAVGAALAATAVGASWAGAAATKPARVLSPVAQISVAKPPGSVGTTITVHRGIGRLVLGQTPGRVKELLGPGQQIRIKRGADGAEPVFKLGYRRYGLAVLFETRFGLPNLSRTIDIRSPQYKTNKGIHVGSSRTDVTDAEAYPKAADTCQQLVGGGASDVHCLLRKRYRQTSFVFHADRLTSIQLGCEVAKSANDGCRGR